jgi:hypothetical protein
MHFSWKRWRVTLIAALTALALSVTLAGPAAAGAPGESDVWNPEMVSNQNQQVASQGTLSEARNGGNLLEVWRGATNNQVWMARNNGDPFTIGGITATNVSPTVVPLGRNAFMVFHTGVDGRIYYTPVFGDGSTVNRWVPVPGQTTNMPVSVTQLGDNSYDLYMVYRAAGDDQRIMGTRYDGATKAWVDTQNIAGGTSPSAPSVTYNWHSDQLTVLARGQDNAVWMTEGWVNAWNDWYSEGGTTIDTPHIVPANNGYMLADYLDANYNVQTRVYDEWGIAIGDWNPETSHWQTHYPAQLAAYGRVIFLIMTTLDGLVWFKQAYSNNN